MIMLQLGKTCLHVAVEANNVDIIRVLCQEPSIVEICDEVGMLSAGVCWAVLLTSR